jgi:pilus assembly protein Flp/PilA
MYTRLSASIAAFLHDEDGPTSVEYAVMLALIIVTCFVAVTSLGSNVKGSLQNSASKIAAAS